jgi:hypothetical protein
MVAHCPMKNATMVVRVQHELEHIKRPRDRVSNCSSVRYWVEERALGL